MNKRDRREYMRTYRAKRKAAGICVRCGRPTNNDHCSCEECLAIANKKAKARYMRRCVEKWKEVQDA